ncbi:hypothetical protein TTHERM_00833690 (macronuclear) [Tetrahymena thermophila SB210]|uniref:Uncharacterized protein n=1 Tax=Tetrahymena thermophila (strain SB210) TaxID=312017 RepID=Q23A49_TETTS|nr:hypothetical protein TTHERM_00833690 [Tetrahymena thermophila SB210]EAR93431.2 hypothetical protein TTHERM_00833690 [Tetrahymena thermophila SB210]|eukprot:XP_001013676.2 hypothetical protein TTHERM_00833690 [Tetrahymena thermophila SB210]
MSKVSKQISIQQDNKECQDLDLQNSMRNSFLNLQQRSAQNKNTKEISFHVEQASKELLNPAQSCAIQHIDNRLNTLQRLHQNEINDCPYDKWLKEIPNPTKNQKESRDQQVFKQRPQINISLDELSRSYRFLQRTVLKFQDVFMRQNKYAKQINLSLKEHNIPISEAEEKILDDVREFIEPQAEWAREVYGDKYFYQKKVALKSQIKNISNCFDKMQNLDNDNSIFFVEELQNEQKKMDYPTLSQLAIYLNCKQALDTQQVQLNFVLITIGQTLPKSFEKYYKRLFFRYNFKITIIHILDIEEKQFQNSSIIQKNIQQKQNEQNAFGSCSSVSENDFLNIENSNLFSKSQSMKLSQAKQQNQYASNLSFKSQPIFSNTLKNQNEKNIQNFKVYNVYLRKNKDFENVKVSSAEFIHLMERCIFPFLKSIKIDIMVFEYDFSFSEDVNQKVVLKTYVLAYIVQKLKEISRDKLLISYIIRQLKTSYDCYNQKISQLSHLLDLKNNIKQKVLTKTQKNQNALQTMKIYFEYSLQIQDSIRKTLIALGQLINYSKYISYKQTDFNFHPCFLYVKHIKEQSNQFLSSPLSLIKDYIKIAIYRQKFTERQLEANTNNQEQPNQMKQHKKKLSRMEKHQKKDSNIFENLNQIQINQFEICNQKIDPNEEEYENFSDKKFDFPQFATFGKFNQNDYSMQQKGIFIPIENQQMQSQNGQFNFQFNNNHTIQQNTDQLINKNSLSYQQNQQDICKQLQVNQNFMQINQNLDQPINQNYIGQRINQNIMNYQLNQNFMDTQIYQNYMNQQINQIHSLNIYLPNSDEFNQSQTTQVFNGNFNQIFYNQDTVSLKNNGHQEVQCNQQNVNSKETIFPTQNQLNDDGCMETSSSFNQKSPAYQTMQIEIPSLNENQSMSTYQRLMRKIPIQQLAEKCNIGYTNFLQLNDDQKKLKIINQIKQKQADYKLKDSIYHILWEKSCRLEVANPSKDFNLKIFYYDEHSQYLVNYQQNPQQTDKIQETKMIVYFFNVRSRDCYNNYVLQQITNFNDTQQKFNVFKLKYKVQTIQFKKISDLDTKINEQNYLKEQLHNAKHTINVSQAKIDDLQKNGLTASQTVKLTPSDLNNSALSDQQGNHENTDSQNNSTKTGSTKVEEKKLQVAINNYKKIITEMVKKVSELEKKIEEIQIEVRGTTKKDENNPSNILKIEGLEEKKIDLSALCIIESALVETEEFIFKFFGRALNIRLLEPLVLKQEIKLIMKINKFHSQQNINQTIEIVDPQFNFEQYKQVMNEIKQQQQQQQQSNQQQSNYIQNPQSVLQQSQRMSRPDQSLQNSADSQLKLQQSQQKPQIKENQSSQSLLVNLKQSIDKQGQEDLSKDKISQLNSVANQKIIQSSQSTTVIKNNLNQSQEQKTNSLTDSNQQQQQQQNAILKQQINSKPSQNAEQKPLIRLQNKQEANLDKSSQALQSQKQKQLQQEQKNQQQQSILKNEQNEANNLSKSSLNQQTHESMLSSKINYNSQKIQDESQMKIYQESFQKKFFRGRFGASAFYFNNKIYIFNGYSQQFMEETSMFVFIPQKPNNNDYILDQNTSILKETSDDKEQFSQHQLHQEQTTMLFYFVMKVSIGKASIKGGYGTFMLPLLRSESLLQKQNHQKSDTPGLAMKDEAIQIQQPNKKLISQNQIAELSKKVKNLLVFSFESYDCSCDLKKQFIKIQVFNPIQKQVLMEKKVSLYNVFTINQNDNNRSQNIFNLFQFFDQPFQNILNVANRNNCLNEFYYELNNELFFTFAVENFRASKLFLQLQINITQISKYFSEQPKSPESQLEASIQIQIINS